MEETDKLLSERGIRTIDEFTDYVHRLAQERAEWDRAKLLIRIHYALVMTLKRTQMSTPDTHHAYFQLCALLTTPTITRSRLLSTIDGIGNWLKS